MKKTQLFPGCDHHHHKIITPCFSKKIFHVNSSYVKSHQPGLQKEFQARIQSYREIQSQEKKKEKKKKSIIFKGFHLFGFVLL